MEERDFELLFALERTQNITRAADTLFISQSAFSKRLLALEQELGVCLLLRSRQGVHFTPEGETVLQYCARAAEQLRQMREALLRAQACVCGTLKVGVSINHALYRLPEQLAAYCRRCPHVETRITTDQSYRLYMQLADGSLDVAILRGDYAWEGERLLLEQERICAIRSRDNAGTPLQELAYVGRKTDADFARNIAKWMRENNLHPKTGGLVVDNITACVEMVSRGLGWSIVPEICLHDFDGAVLPLCFADGTPLLRSTYLMYYASALALPQVRAFIETIRNRQP